MQFPNVSDNNISRQRLTQAEKNANDKQWYKFQADLLDSHSFSNNTFIGFGGVSDYKRKKVNYDLFNNIINQRDFEYVCQPYGSETGELPANMVNRDIVSGKVKALLGMEMKMPFSWKVVATNEEATTRKEQEEARRIREFVTNEVMRPIRMEVERELMEQTAGKKLSQNEQEQLKAKIDEETQARTPDEVRKYMAREHQDPAEMQAKEILEYLIQKEKVKDKFNKGFKHSCLGGEEIYFVGILNGEPTLKVINTLFFDNDMSSDLDYIEDGEWAVCEYRMTPSEVVANFGSELTEDEIDKIYSKFSNNPAHLYAEDFTFDTEKGHEPYTIRVLHTTWKSLKKIGFLSFVDRNGKLQMTIVDENYKKNKEQGDKKIEWEWIPETHEAYKILDDIYAYCRPIPGQHKDLDNLYVCKLPYYGAACDSLNSVTTAPMDRMKAYQYFYDIIIYRVELLMASDKGKILAANINAVPKSAGIDIHKFQYFMEANKIAWFNPQEEGNKGSGDVTNLAKEIDMSLASDIDNYIKLAEYIERKCGSAVGVTPQMEAQIGADEAVSNTRQNLVQASHIIQPYFELHNIVKGNVLTALLETAKVAYSTGKPRKLSYVLDDMSVKMFEVDQGLLDSSTFGLFISNSSKADDAKRAVEQLAQAALQNQQATLSDIVKIIRSESVTEAEEMLEAANEREKFHQQQLEKIKAQAAKEADARLDERERNKQEHEKEMIILKEKERRKTEIAKQAMLSVGFNEDKDVDDDGELDVLEIAKDGVDASIKQRKQDLEEEKFAHQKEVDKEKLTLDKRKLAQDKNKPKSK